MVESGVHWGYGILIHFSLSFDGNRKIYGFDSFQGHSVATTKDKSGGQYQALDNSFAVSQEDVWRTLELGTGLKREMLQDKVALIPGWIQQSMPHFLNSESIDIALVHADCDIYEPFKATLDATWPYLVVNGVVILGILDNPELMGKTLAVKEFLTSIDTHSYELKTRDVYDNGWNLVRQSYLVKTK